MANNFIIRPNFHITADKGWINDPNGLVKFNGKYHVFYQHYPKDTCWGPMHWGHVVSDDLITWERLPIAIAPSGAESGCFSGCSIVWQNKLWLIYTGFYENGGGENIRQVQCLASSQDGVNFVKHGVIIDEKSLPSIYNPCDFRDPNVWQVGNTFYMVVAGKVKNGKGRVLSFKSNDLFKWEFIGDIFNKDSKGEMIECPDYSPEMKLLTTSEQFQPREGYTHLNVHSTRWFTGNFNSEYSLFNIENQGIVDYGFDFYAPQSFKGENVLIGWLDMWDRNNPSDKYGFAGMLTVPRKLQLINGELYQTPIYSGEKVVDTKVENYFTDESNSCAITINIKNLKDFSLKVRAKGDSFTEFRLDGDKWIFDRSKSGEVINGVEKDEYSVNALRPMPYEKTEDTLITVIIDLFSVEIFVNGKSSSNTVYPDLDAKGILLKVNAEDCRYSRYEIGKNL